MREILNLPIGYKRFNNILLQILLIKYIIKNDGRVDIKLRYSNFANDIIFLLNFIFKKIYVFSYTHKIGTLFIHIIAKHYVNIDDNLYEKIYNILEHSYKTNTEVVSLFKTSNLIDIHLINTNFYKSTNKITHQINVNKNILLKNIELIRNKSKKITINDFFQT
jgi:hypothetical protein